MSSWSSINRSRPLLWLAILLVAAGCKVSSPLYPTQELSAPSTLLVGVSVHDQAPDGLDLVRRDEDGLTWLAQAKATGAQPLVIVGYGSHESIPIRCAHAADAGAWIEFWNEPNLSAFWGYDADTGQKGDRAPDPERWVELLRACRAAAPNAVIAGPALGGSDWDWEYLEAATRAGMARFLDIITVHGYATHPDRLQMDIAKVRSITGGASRIAISEWAFRPSPHQHEHIRRALEAASRAGLEGVIFYAGRDNPLTDQSLGVLQRWRAAQ